MAKYEGTDVKRWLNVIGEVYRVVGDYPEANSLVDGGKNISSLESILSSAMEIPVDLMYPELGVKLSVLRGAVEKVKEKNKKLGKMRF
jgi:hypothetical protein